MRAEVDDAEDKVLSANAVSGNLEDIYADANTNISVGADGDPDDDGLSANVHSLHSTFLKEAGGNIADQTAAIKAEIQDNITGKATVGMIIADIFTAGTNAGSAVTNSEITEGMGDTPLSLLSNIGPLDYFFNEQELKGVQIYQNKEALTLTGRDASIITASPLDNLLLEWCVPSGTSQELWVSLNGAMPKV